MASEAMLLFSGPQGTTLVAIKEIFSAAYQNTASGLDALVALKVVADAIEGLAVKRGIEPERLRQMIAERVALFSFSEHRSTETKADA